VGALASDTLRAIGSSCGGIFGPFAAQRNVLQLSCFSGDQTMTIAEILLQDNDVEVKNTHTTLERVPAKLGEFKPHEKSMPMGRIH
jgi:hypothetical protein